ncbi:TetR/AcrR family transcriptional regulator [Streptomyces luomodiensis]|uniref:TetR/AcrR family transcriptional regulator n=1 Tax=Streptomyces luomodiensis TaxID=3026192 RepID=A0ABY9UR36_9ACTN|nr:TetR/AcrR family transcriptional regulator [Streptomyces sp. SCA4-21]WNE94365.1 TetR/AcrR family transcriptional regulator [Streptomyces sp. SCA4-21]
MTSGRHGLQPRKQPRQARAELTRQRILTAAAHVFAEYGYAAGTTNRIAERARVSIGSLYQYYPNKDAILVELLTRHLDAGEAAVRRRQQEELPDSLEEIMRGLVRTAIENHLDDPRLLRVMVEHGRQVPGLIEKMARRERERIAYIRELLESHPEAVVEDTEVAARLIVTTIERVVHVLIAAPDTVDPARLENELVAMVIRYLTGAPAGPPVVAETPGERSPTTR